MSELRMQDIKFLSGVGPKKSSLLNTELDIYNCEDLLYYFPYKYIDRTRIYKIREVDSSLPYIQVKGTIDKIEKRTQGKQQRLIAYFTDGENTMQLVWFKGLNWIEKNIQHDLTYIAFGKPSIFNGQINIVHPELDPANKKQGMLNANLQAFYNTSEKLKNAFVHSKLIHKLQSIVITSLNGKIPETLPHHLLQKLNLLKLYQSLLNIHFPQDALLLRKAEYRLKFEELFYVQLNILKQKKFRQKKHNGIIFEKVGDYFTNFYSKNLPFELTNAQKKVLKEIRKDVKSSLQMNRLLQGDVGSGKTLVAIMTMIMALDNGYQACLMAPTEILANQHFQSIKEFLTNLGITIDILTGSTKTKQRKLIHQQLLSGELQIIIGTHALIEDIVQFKNLGIVIIDEQHRFGVAQRSKLWKKNTVPPHILVMTATPIPRTLAMTVYGDLEVSVIDELPPGRKPIQTYHFFENKRNNVNKFITEQVEMGRQIYIVYPLIQESETMDYKNLEDGYEYIFKTFPQYTISIVHGKLKPKDKEAAMQKFVQGETQIMVATTVIEVGVDVPNASVIVIESTERFGLSQLHQLRGRVGRDANQSFCILMSSPKLSHEGRKRIETMVRTNDGFEISEVDLKLRGPGDIQGTQQSGVPFNFKIANIIKDSSILEDARNIALEILDDDPKLEKEENHILAKNLTKITSKQVNWAFIS